jgi:hypothetical protein
MYDGGKIITGLIIGLAFFIIPIWMNLGKAAKAPELELTEKAKAAGSCVADTSYMKASHFSLLDKWRHEVVRDADRFYKSKSGKIYYKSLQVTCMDCHSNKSKFCDQCHNYMSVKPYCWDCHLEPKEKS